MYDLKFLAEFFPSLIASLSLLHAPLDPARTNVPLLYSHLLPSSMALETGARAAARKKKISNKERRCWSSSWIWLRIDRWERILKRILDPKPNSTDY